MSITDGFFSQNLQLFSLALMQCTVQLHSIKAASISSKLIDIHCTQYHLQE